CRSPVGATGGHCGLWGGSAEVCRIDPDEWWGDRNRTKSDRCPESRKGSYRSNGTPGIRRKDICQLRRIVLGQNCPVDRRTARPADTSFSWRILRTQTGKGVPRSQPYLSCPQSELPLSRRA